MVDVTDKARYAHWIDLHDMGCDKAGCKLCSEEKNFDSTKLWNELDTIDVFRAQIPPVPDMPQPGDKIFFKSGEAIFYGEVMISYPQQQKFLVKHEMTGINYHCTLADVAVSGYW